MTAGAETVERMLQDIEHHVLEDVWFGRGRFAAGCSIVIVLFTTAASWWLDAAGGVSNPVPTVAAAMLLFAAGVSGLALALRRYRWCCAAAYCCGLASVIGIGAFWWLRTGPPGAALAWLTLAAMTVVVLTIYWLAVIITPIELSQPDMRKPQAHQRRRGID